MSRGTSINVNEEQRKLLVAHRNYSNIINSQIKIPGIFRWIFKIFRDVSVL